jgi:hypothetical protein
LSGEKRTYEAMQGASKKTCKLSKKPKLMIDKAAADEGNADESSNQDTIHQRPVHKTSSCEPVGDNRTNVPTTLASNNPTTSGPNIMESRGPLGEREENGGIVAGPALADPVDDGAGMPASGLSAITHADGLAILDEYFPRSGTGSGPLSGVLISEPSTSPARVARPGSPGVTQTPSAGPDVEVPKEPETPYPGRVINSVEAVRSISHSGSPGSVSSSANPTRCPSYETNATDVNSLDVATYPPFNKRVVLDDRPQLLEHVLVALDGVYNDRRPPTSSIPGVLDEIRTTSDLGIFVKMMTGITENWATCNRLIARPVLEVAQERLAEVEQDASSRSRSDRFQMSITRGDCTKSDHLRHTIACRDRRELSEIELRDILAEPLELMGEFTDESDYKTAIKRIEKEKADGTTAHLRRMWKESYYWPMIQKRAKMIGPQPNASGPRSQISAQEKVAAKQLVAAMGYGQSRNNVFKWTSYLQLLSNLREKGATSLLLCRTSEFKNYFFQRAKGLDVLLSWNRVYDFPLQQLRLRVIAEEAGDFSGKSDIEERWIFARLHAPQNMCWNDHLTLWDQDSGERDRFLANHSIEATSTKSNAHVLRHGIKGQLERNKSIFINFIPYEGTSDKRTFSNKTASTELLAVAPLVTVTPGDFLGIFPGRLRYTDAKPARAIGGPISNLWLDYSEVMGKMNQIRVAKAGEITNVCLAWEGVNEVEGDKTLCEYLRVLVLATRHIMQFDRLIRPPSAGGMLSEVGKVPTSLARSCGAEVDLIKNNTA